MPTCSARCAAALAVAVGALVLASAPAAAQDRPSEEDLFGAPPREPPAKTEPSPGKPEPSRAAPEESSRPEESQLFGAPPAAQAAPPPPQGIMSREREDALRIGGQLYLRAQTQFRQDVAAGDAGLSSPNLLDVYLDARPNDRVRGFVLGRLSYDPTLAPPGTVPASGSTLASLASSFGRTTANPSAVLDQLWVNFDVGRRVFVTAGRQHAKWGVGHFWNPTDYLHPVKRDPLQVFDVRTGTTMVKVHLPWESRGWNAYGVAMLEDVSGDTREATNRIGRVATGGRAEIVLGTVELGADALSQNGHRPRFGVDVSAGVWDLDLYAEAALRTSVDTPRWRLAPATLENPLGIVRDDPIGWTPQVTVGGSWSVKYSDEDVVTFGAEYFYDRSGYESAGIYPRLLGVAALGPLPSPLPAPFPAGAPNAYSGQPSPFTPFYLGRQYGGAFVSLPKPGSWNDTTFTLSVLANLSDRTFIARLDHSVLALTYLRVETFLAGTFGERDGEFRLGFAIPAGQLGPAAIVVPPMVFQAGAALRVSL